MTSTSYPPPAWASSALTGTTSTLFTLPVVTRTVTGACDSPPAACGCVSDTVTGTEVTPDALVVATFPTAEITPGVVVPSGSVTPTWSPSLTSPSWEGSRLIVATGIAEVAVISASPGVAAAPSVTPVSHAEIRAAVGRNTACPRVSDPVGLVMPSAVWYCSSAKAVFALKSRNGSSSALAEYPSAIRFSFSSRTSGPLIPSDKVR